MKTTWAVVVDFIDDHGPGCFRPSVSAQPSQNVEGKRNGGHRSGCPTDAHHSIFPNNSKKNIE